MIELLPASRSLSILVLGAHPDDIEIGCGGTLIELQNRPLTRVSCFIATGSRSRRTEARQSLEALLPGGELQFGDLDDGRLPSMWNELKDLLESLSRRIEPDVIFAPRTDDAHQDHRLVGSLVTTVWRDSLVLHYEIPKWDADLARPTHYVPLTDDVAHQKVQHLNRFYPSQVGRDWWDDETFLGLMRLRGVECRSRYAEGFSANKVTLTFSPERREGG